MENQKFPTVDINVIETVIQLAELRAQADCNKYPNGFIVGETKPLPESTEALKLKSFINELAPNDAKELYALMYLGRDGLGGDTAAKAIAFSLDQAASLDDFDIKDKLDEKTPLATYLSKGIELAKDTNIAEIEKERR